MNRTVLLVEDNEDLNEINRCALADEGYHVLTARTLKEAREHLSRASPDVILLDVMLPDGNGMDFCAEIRSGTDAHILFLTSRTEHAQQIQGFTKGGDDYITKPFKLDVLIQRVASVMRRRGMDKGPVQTIEKGNLKLDFVAGRAFIGGADLLLQPKEFALLRLFSENENKMLDTEMIYKSVWGQPLYEDKNAVQAAVSRLRKKIEYTGYDILGKRNQGYTFEKRQ